jgi:replication initiation protein RepC
MFRVARGWLAKRPSRSDGDEPAGQTIDSSLAPIRQEPAETGRVLKLHSDELVHLAPRLMPYLRQPSPTWPEVVDAARPRPIQAAMGRGLPRHGTRAGGDCAGRGVDQGPGAFPDDPPGGYFHGMVTKAKAGELNLDRTLWAMRRAAQPKPHSQAVEEYSGRRSPGRLWS